MKNHTALLWDFFSWLEHPPPTHSPTGRQVFFKKSSLGGPWKRWWQFTGFSSKPWARKLRKKQIPSFNEMASIWNQRLYSISGCSLKCKVFLAVLDLLKMSLWKCYAGYTLHPVLIMQLCTLEPAHTDTHTYILWLYVEFIDCFYLFVEYLLCTTIKFWPRFWVTAGTQMQKPSTMCREDMKVYFNRGKKKKRNPHFPLISLSFPCSVSPESAIKWVLLQYPSQAPF